MLRNSPIALSLAAYDGAPSTAVAEKQSLVRTPDEGAPSGVEHEPAADEAKLLVRWKQQVGAFLVFLVALMYVGSGVMIQLLFEELEFEKPFFFSFASVALCSCHLGFFSLLRCRAVCRRRVAPSGGGGGGGAPRARRTPGRARVQPAADAEAGERDQPAGGARAAGAAARAGVLRAELHVLPLARPDVGVGDDDPVGVDGRVDAHLLAPRPQGGDDAHPDDGRRRVDGGHVPRHVRVARRGRGRAGEGAPPPDPPAAARRRRGDRRRDERGRPARGDVGGGVGATSCCSAPSSPTRTRCTCRRYSA